MSIFSDTNGRIRWLVRIVDLRTVRYADYQRAVLVRQVDAIADNYNPLLLGELVISERDGVEWGVSGQHRIHALLKMGITHHLCKVYTGLTYEEEAELFHGLDTRRQHTTGDRHRANAEAGNAEARDIDSILIAAGWPKAGARPNQTRAVGACYTAYAMGRQDFFDAMRVLNGAWHDRKGATAPLIIKGLTRFINIYRDSLNYEQLTYRLRAYPGGPSGLKADVQGGRFPYGAKSPEMMFVSAFVEIYNKGRKGKDKLVAV